MEALRKLLKDLGSDAKLAAEYERSPDEVMKARGLPEDARAAMKAKMSKPCASWRAWERST